MMPPVGKGNSPLGVLALALGALTLVLGSAGGCAGSARLDVGMIATGLVGAAAGSPCWVAHEIEETTSQQQVNCILKFIITLILFESVVL